MRSAARRLGSHRRQPGSGSWLRGHTQGQAHGEFRAPIVDDGDIATMAARNLPDQGKTKSTPLTARRRLGAEAFLEDLAVDALRNSGPGIEDSDHQLLVLLR